MATYQILSWHGIPTGVKAKDENGEKRVNLARRFQVTVDDVATKTGNIGTKAYLSGWHWSEPVDQEGSAVQVAGDLAAQIEEEYTAEKVKSLRQELEISLQAN